MKNKNNSITKTYKSERSFGEIDFKLRDEIIGRNWDEQEFEQTTLNKNMDGWQGESCPIKIDTVVETLNELKKDGCNYVEIMYHGDHIGYYFYGLDVYRSTDKEIADKKNMLRKDKKEEKKSTIKELEKRLKELKK